MSGLPLLGVEGDDLGAPVTTPLITVSTPSLAFGNIGTNQSSSSQNYQVSGSDLVGNITITAPSGYIINLDNSNTNASPIVLTQVLGVVAATTIYVKFQPASIGVYNEDITHVSSGAVSKNVAVTGTAPQPSVSVIPNTMSFADTIVGAYSVAQSYVVSGLYLMGSVVITPPAGFIVNTDGSDTDMSPIILPPTNGTLSNTTIYVKFHPGAVMPFSDDIFNASLNAVTANVNVSGNGITPLIGASVSSISGLTYQQGFGPSAASSSFRITGAGLLPAASVLTVTPSADIEIYDGTTWQASAFTIPYTGSTLITAFIYMVRLKAGLGDDPYSESVSVSGGGATTLVIPVTGTVTPPPPTYVLNESGAFVLNELGNQVTTP